MKLEGNSKLIIIGIGAAIAYSQFGPMGLIAVGVLLLLMN